MAVKDNSARGGREAGGKILKIRALCDSGVAG